MAVPTGPPQARPPPLPTVTRSTPEAARRAGLTAAARAANAAAQFPSQLSRQEVHRKPGVGGRGKRGGGAGAIQTHDLEGRRRSLSTSVTGSSGSGADRGRG